MTKYVTYIQRKKNVQSIDYQTIGLPKYKKYVELLGVLIANCRYSIARFTIIVNLYNLQTAQRNGVDIIDLTDSWIGDRDSPG